MCTVDPMGFTPQQAVTVPFLVLLKAIEDFKWDPTEKKKFVLDLIMESCVNLLQVNENLRRQIIE